MYVNIATVGGCKMMGSNERERGRGREEDEENPLCPSCLCVYVTFRRTWRDIFTRRVMRREGALTHFLPFLLTFIPPTSSASLSSLSSVILSLHLYLSLWVSLLCRLQLWYNLTVQQTALSAGRLLKLHHEPLDYVLRELNQMDQLHIFLDLLVLICKF